MLEFVSSFTHWVLPLTAAYLALCAACYALGPRAAAAERRAIKFLSTLHAANLTVLSLVMTAGMAWQIATQAGFSLCNGRFFRQPFWIYAFSASKALEMVDTVLRLLSGGSPTSVIAF